MNVIYKYKLDPTWRKIDMPKCAKILHVGEQFNEVCIWAEVDTDNAMETRTFEVFGTGHQIPYDIGASRNYVGTVMLDGGSLVFHVYERIT